MDASYDTRKGVFNTGINKETFLHNLKLLEAEMSEVDCVVIDQGHGDHSTAMVEVVEAANGTKVYGYPHSFLPESM